MADQTEPPPAPVASRITQARRAADATRADVERLSQAHLHALLADPTAILTEHVDDPDLTPADRARLLATIQARQEKGARKQSGTKLSRRRPLLPQPRTLAWGAAALILGGVLVGVPLRNTAERAIVISPFVVQFEPVHLFRSQTAQPGQTVFVRRWLRWTPVAVAWAEDAHTYITAPLPRSAITFPDFPFLDGAFWRDK